MIVINLKAAYENYFMILLDFVFLL